MAIKEIRAQDLVIDRYRATGQTLSENGVACRILHTPTGKVGNSNNPDLKFFQNKKDAMRDLEKQFGIKPAPTKSSYTCSACHQRHHADAPTDWTKTIYYSKAVAGVGEVNAYEVEGGEGNFRWEYVSEDGGDSDADEDRIYITLSAACDAAKAHLEGQVEWYKKIAKEEQENGE